MATKRQTCRFVLLVCGPPGAGKTTYARELAAKEGLDVYDVDDPKWDGSEQRFRSALRKVGASSVARAVVIRSGATCSARTKAVELVRASDVKVFATPSDICKQRVVARKRPTPPIRTQIAAVDSWWQRYDLSEPLFFEAARALTPRSVKFPSPTPKGRRGRGRARKASTNARGYGAKHQKLRAHWTPLVEAGEVRCARTECRELIVPGEPWDLGHDDHDRSRYTGPEHRRCNRATAGRRQGRRRWQSRVW